MRHLTPFVVVYAVAAVLIVPGSLLAAEGDGTTQQEAGGQATALDQPSSAPAPAGAPAAGDGAAPAAQAAPPAAAPPPAVTPQAPAAPAPGTAPAPVAAVPPPAAAPAEAPKEPERTNVLAQAAAGVSITIRDFDFSPASVTIDVGDTVTWSNAGPTLHTATANDGSFDTGNLTKGQSGSHTFSKAGTFAYICTPHPFMKGTVTVRAAGAGGGGGGDDSTSSDDGAGGDSGSSGSGSGAGGSGSGATGATGAEDDSSASGSGSGPSLPATGADAAALALFGALLLVLGLVTHRRTLAREPGPAGRIGW